MKIVLLTFVMASPYVSNSNICTQLRSVTGKVPRNSSIPGHTDASHSLAECGVKLHKQSNFTSAVYTKENTCMFYSDVTPEDNLVTVEGRVYISKVCTASACDDCWYRKLNNEVSGTYQIRISGHQHNVFCDMDTDGCGWTVFQRRLDGSVDFYRDWNSYKQGFGDVASEHWLGNDVISALTTRGPHELRIDLELSNQKAYAKYSSFSVDPEANQYTLHVSGYTGTAGDSMVPSSANNVLDGRAFSTHNRDNDLGNDNCALVFQGAWWHNNCQFSNLNGPYLGADDWICIVWYTWLGERSLKRSVMMLRPIN